MDEETKKRFDELTKTLSDYFELIETKLISLQADLHSLRGHMLRGLHENLTLSQRIAKLEELLRKR